MALPPILQQLGRNPLQNPMMGKIKQMYKAVCMAQDPQAALNQMVQSNPQLQQVMQFVNMSGKDPMALFTALAQQSGINPQEIMDELKQGL